MRASRLIFGVIAIAVLGVLAAWRLLSPPSVVVATVHRALLTDTLSATGVVEAIQAEVAPKLVGRVHEVLVEEGDRVEQGQVLARLDSAELRAVLAEREAALRVARAQVSGARAALDQERAAGRARIRRARAAEEAAKAQLEELQAGSRPQEIERAQQGVAAARAEQGLAASELSRMSRLHAEGAISRAQLDAAETRSAEARAGLRSARQHLALLQEGARPEQIAAAAAQHRMAQAELAAAHAADQVVLLQRALTAAQAAAHQAEAAVAVARTTLAEAEVTSPIPGHVGRRYLDPGDLASPSSPAFLISDTDRIWVTAEVDEEDLSLVHRGQPVQIAAESLPSPLSGAVAEVGPVAVSRGLQQVRAKIVRCRVILEEPSSLLRPGMEVDISAQATLAESALAVPAGALLTSDDTAYVFVVQSRVLRKREVEVGRRTYRSMEVTSGLREGDLIVVDANEKLRDGQKVTVAREQRSDR